MTTNVDVHAPGGKHENLLGTVLHTDPTPRALPLIDYRETIVVDMNGIEGTDRLTGTQSQAAVATAFAPAGDNHSRLAVTDPMVLETRSRLMSATFAQKYGNAAFGLEGLDSHDGGNVANRFLPPGNATVHGGSLFDHDPGVSPAAGKSTDAAIDTGKGLLHTVNQGVSVNGEPSGCQSQPETRHETNST
jgi:hypothetical protein